MHHYIRILIIIGLSHFCFIVFNNNHCFVIDQSTN